MNFIDWYEDTGTSSYNALRAELRHQFAHTFEADVQYQWAHSLDNGSGPYTQSDYQWLPGHNWGNSDYDVRNTIKMFGMWSPVIFHGNTMAEKLVGGWTFSPIFVYHSGFPYNPKYSGTRLQCVLPRQWQLRSAAFLQGRRIDQPVHGYFKTAAGHFPKGGSFVLCAAGGGEQHQRWLERHQLGSNTVGTSAGSRESVAMLSSVRVTRISILLRRRHLGCRR